MSVGYRLTLNVLAWTASIPVLNVLLVALDRHEIVPLSENSVGAVAVALAVWAGWIYRRCVPPSARMPARSARFAIFGLTLLLASAVALYMAFWITVAIYGL